ncbi:MAG: arginine repressor [Clostridia bacterium]|nr:arginine repressor [Clostridia bacterium]
MARSVRQSKIIEIINKQEIETQDELVEALKQAGFKVTQATISRDIKELCLFKISGETKKYRYSFVDSEDRTISSKTNDVFKNVVLSITPVFNQVLVKTIRGTSESVALVVDKLGMSSVIGCVSGSDALLIVTDSAESAVEVCERLNELLIPN